MSKYFCPVCKSTSLSNTHFIEAGTYYFYHHIRFELLSCTCGRKALGLYYFEEERHGHPDSENHIGYLIADDTYLDLQKIMLDTPSVFQSVPASIPYKFEEFFPIPIPVSFELLFALKAFQEQRESTKCLEHNRHLILRS